MTELSLIAQRNIRDKYIKHTEVLDKVKALPLLPKFKGVTIKQMADYYGVPVSTAKGFYKLYKEEIQCDGAELWTLERMSENFNLAYRFGNTSVFQITKDTTLDVPKSGLIMLSKRAVLRFGMLLQGNDVASKVRRQLLEEVVVDELTLVKPVSGEYKSVVSEGSELSLVKSESFGEIACDIYEGNDDFYMTRRQIGEALEYKDPQNAIDKIHKRQSDRLNSLSVTAKLSGADGKFYNTTVYNRKGVMEICRWSRQPIADAFMDWAWDVMDGLITGKTKLVANNDEDNLLLAIVKGDSIEIRAMALGEYTTIKNGQISALKDQVIELKQDNTALAEGILDWENRSKINRAVRVFASIINYQIGGVWSMLYKELLYKHNIGLKQRGASPYLDHLQEDEWPVLVQSFAALCDSFSVSLAKIFEDAKLELPEVVCA